MLVARHQISIASMSRCSLWRRTRDSSLQNVGMANIPANTRRSADVVSMLAHRLRRWLNLKTTPTECLVFVRMATGHGSAWPLYYKGCRISRLSDLCLTAPGFLLTQYPGYVLTAV